MQHISNGLIYSYIMSAPRIEKGVVTFYTIINPIAVFLNLSFAVENSIHMHCTLNDEYIKEYGNSLQ